MEGIRGGVPVVSEIAARLKPDHFTLIDVGCSGGIDLAWRDFGVSLRAFGFDPNLEDVKKLQAAETLPGVEYVGSFVGIPNDDPGASMLRANAFTSRNPWGRFSVARTLEIRSAKATSNVQKTQLNQWKQVPLADADNPIVLQSFLQERKVDDIDFIKIDVDGADFLILRSLRTVLDDACVLGICVEINYFGSDDPNTNTFHNVDRLLKSIGFELFDVTKRHYSMVALPAPYVYSVPAQSQWGRILQGDALYFRDLAAPHNSEFAGSLSATKVAKLAALFAMFGLPDCAAELFLKFRPQLSSILDVEKNLNALVKQAVPPGNPVPSYAEYIREFESDGRRFYR